MTKKASAPPDQLETPYVLIGATRRRIEEIEQFLPNNSQIEILFVAGPNKQLFQRAAVQEADLDGDGVNEVIAVHTVAPVEGEALRELHLSVLKSEGEFFIVKSVNRLLGISLFPIAADGEQFPVICRDVTGDGRPEIIVAPAYGASVGASVQIFDQQR